LSRIYKLLDDHFGDLKWWPADSDFEVIVGAILTQNTSWSNVECVIKDLKKQGLMDPVMMMETKTSRLSSVIRSSGYHRVKAARLKEICCFILEQCGGDLLSLKKRGTGNLREILLGVNGIGPETADSILLYAFGKPVFVVDNYAKRIFSRHGLADNKIEYDNLQKIVHENFCMKVKDLNQFHALLVEAGKRFCRKKAGICGECPLRVLL